MSSLPNNAKAVIALTSWKARIHTVGQTIFSLLIQCPNYHIVLTLSSDEFPNKLSELPNDLIQLYNKGLIEILWVSTNYRSFKKILFAMDKYKDVPIISADDDCLYYCNYADKMYNIWKQHPNCVVTLGPGANGNSELGMEPWPTGSKSLYPPYCFKDAWKPLLPKIYTQTNDDDTFYSFMINHIFHIKILSPYTDAERKVYVFHDSINALSSNKRKYGYHQAMKVIVNAIKG